MLTTVVFVIGIVCVYGLASRAGLASGESDDRSTPRNLAIDPAFAPLVDRMLQRSPTFRDQVSFLGGVERLRVRVLARCLPLWAGSSSIRAESIMRRYEFGFTEAVVRVGPVLNAPELLAHELEHVREYVEGVEFRRLAARSGGSVWASTTGVDQYETARAIAIGRQVAREMTLRPISP